MKILTTAMMFFALAACGDSRDDVEAEAPEEKVFDPLIQSLDKAKTVEDTVLQQKKEMDEAMKKMEEGDGKHNNDQ